MEKKIEELHGLVSTLRENFEKFKDGLVTESDFKTFREKIERDLDDVQVKVNRPPTIAAPVTPADGRLVLRQTYNYNDFYFDRDLLWEGNRLPVVPEHQYRGELTWRHPSGLFVTPTVEWRIDDVWVD